ncbi:MAG TPA: Hsp20/alpha crystallin family protein [Xanthomonadales bacterium]
MTTKAKAKEKKVEVKKVKEKAEESFLPSLRHDIEDAFTHVLESWPRPSMHWRWPDFDPMDMFSLPLAPTRKMDLPKVDFSEVDGSYELTAELPGMTDKDVECTLSGNMLTVKGEKREDMVKEKKGYHLQERRYGSFMRSFPLPKDVNPDKIEASVTNGLLKVVLPKDAKKETTRKIELKKA